MCLTLAGMCSHRLLELQTFRSAYIDENMPKLSPLYLESVVRRAALSYGFQRIP